MSQPVETGPARSDKPAPIVLVPKPPRPAPGKPRSGKRWLIVGIFALLLTAAASATWWYAGSSGTVDYATAAVTRGNVTRMVTATGTVNPMLTIIVGSYVSGVIQDIRCDYNTEVKKGEICAKIDPRPYQTIVDQNTANLAVAKAQLEKDKAIFAYAGQSYQRNVRLAAANTISKDTLESARSVLDSARAQIGVDEATIQQRQAQLEAAEVNLGYTNIVSPVDGTVVSRNVTIGQTVAASFQTPTLFLIATDLTKMQVDTNVSESDIGGIQNGHKALFTVDAFPSRTFQGTVTQARQSPQTVQNVVTYDVVVSVDNPDLLLKPGMTAANRIVIAERENVMRVPSQALRYSPTGAPGGHDQSGLTTQPSINGTQPGHVYVLRDGKPVAVQVTAGLDDDSFAEILKGDLQPGDRVIIGEQRSGSGESPRTSSAPRLRL